MGHVVAVVGLGREAAVLRTLDVVTVAGGGAPERLAGELATLAKGADGIVSFGMAGALAPDLRLGDWVIGSQVGERACDARWIAALARRLPEARIGSFYASNALVSQVIDKERLNRHSGHIAADMESHVAAKAAADVGVPFAVLRCISDEARHALPPAIAVAMKPGGGLALGAVLASVFAHPGQVPDLIRTVAGFNRAYDALKAGARRAGYRLACDFT